MYPVCEDVTRYTNLTCVGNVLTVLCPPRRYILPLFGEFHRGIDTEKIGLLNAASHEMEQAYRAIAQYASLVEEQRLGKEMALSGFDFDEVSETGVGLKFIANAFYLILNRSPIWLMNHQGTTDVATATIELLGELDAFMERRNIALHFEQEAKDALVPLDEMVVRHVLWAVYSLCVRHAANESSMTIRIRRSEGGMLEASVEIGSICRDTLPTPCVDFYPCIPTSRQNFSARLMPVLSAHINTRIARYLLRRCGGRLVIQSPSKNSIRMVVVFAL